MEGKYVDTELRVRYIETDRMGRVHHANHLIYFEVGRSDFCRQTGLPYDELEKAGYYLVVSEARIRYRAPFSYDELIKVRTFLVSANRRKIVFGYHILDESGDRVLAEGETHHIVTNADGKTQMLPDKYFRYYQPFL